MMRQGDAGVPRHLVKRGTGDKTLIETLIEAARRLDLTPYVAAAASRYRETSLQLDASLRGRLFEPPARVPSREQLLEKSRGLDAREEELRVLGLLPKDFAPAPAVTMDDADLGKHTVLLADRAEKLAVFSVVVAKARRLLKLLRLVRPKRAAATGRLNNSPSRPSKAS